MDNFKKVMVEQEGTCTQMRRRTFVAEIPAHCDPEDLEFELTELADEVGVEWWDEDQDETEVTESHISDADEEYKLDVRHTKDDEEPSPQTNSLIDRLSYIATDVESEMGSEAADEFRAWLERWDDRQLAEAAVEESEG